MNQFSESSLKVLLNMFGGLKSSVGIMPKFSGEDGLSADEFISKFEDYCKFNKYDEKTKLEVLVLCLEKEAFWWFEEIRSEVDLSWLYFKKLFGEQYDCDYIRENTSAVCETLGEVTSVESENRVEADEEAELVSDHFLKETIVYIDNIRVKASVGSGFRNYISEDFLGRVNKQLYSLVDTGNDKVLAGDSTNALCSLPVEFRDGSVDDMEFYVMKEMDLNYSVALYKDEKEENKHVSEISSCSESGEGFETSLKEVIIEYVDVSGNYVIEKVDGDSDFKEIQNVVVAATKEIADVSISSREDIIGISREVISGDGMLNLDSIGISDDESKKDWRIFYESSLKAVSSYENWCDYSFWFEYMYVFGIFLVLMVNYFRMFFVNILIFLNFVFDRGKQNQ